MKFLQRISYCLVLMAFLIQTAIASDKQPNIVLILADDLGFSDIGLIGGDINTPNIDKLAQQGITFTQFYNNAKCTLSRESLMKGLYAQQTKFKKKKAGRIIENNVTIAEVLKEHGYETSMAGKWHLSRGNPKERGFSSTYSFKPGSIPFWQPEKFSGNYTNKANTQYATDLITDAGLHFIEASVKKNKPFFSYLAYNAPHYPLHAPEEDIAKYKGKFDQGWDSVRNNRIAHMKKQGFIGSDFQYADRLTDNVSFDKLTQGWQWQNFSAKERAEQSRLMEVYAAMVDRLDQNIGRVLNKLKALNIEDNTLVIFLSDNGGSPYPNGDKPGQAIGPKGSYRTLNTPWAQISSAPFRLFKRYVNEGGISTPMIARWPAVIKNQGARIDDIQHVIDFMPTFVELTGATYPTEYAGNNILPMAGLSFANTLKGKKSKQHKVMYWDYNGKNKAIRQGNMKLVYNDIEKEWQLFDLLKDRGETNNIIKAHTALAKALKAKWNAWSKKVKKGQAFTAAMD